MRCHDRMSHKVILKPLTYEELTRLNQTNVRGKGIDFSELVITAVQREAIQIKIEKMNRIKREFHHWFTYWLMIHKQSKQVMGLIGFKGIDQQGMCEIGYGITQKFSGNRYTSEAVKILIHWAFQHDFCKAIIAAGVFPWNYRSQRVLINNGFRKIGTYNGRFSYRLNRESLYSG